MFNLKTLYILNETLSGTVLLLSVRGPPSLGVFRLSSDRGTYGSLASLRLSFPFGCYGNLLLVFQTSP